ncbi:MAG TPA: nitrous oxide reductase family maturation protein NosD [Longimicrobiales bacterium]
MLWAFALLSLLAVTEAQAQQAVLTVGVGGDVPTISEALRRIPAGGRIIVGSGRYQEPTLVISKPVEIIGQDYPVLDGRNQHELIRIQANDVTVRGLEIRNVGVSYVEDRAGIKVEGARRCRIENNRLINTFFAIYLSSSQDCRITNNVIRGQGTREAATGNGIHLWYSRNVEIAGNQVTGHRDGIYFEWVQASRITGNKSAENLRYGLHFMFSDSCAYAGNLFTHNRAGVAVMYTRNVTMIENRIIDNWGGAAYGLLLKDIRHSRIERNEFTRNTVGVHFDGSSHVTVEGNRFRQNGWATRVLANSTDNRFEGNSFTGNMFDVTTNSRASYNNIFLHNYWDAYRGYDLDHDGVGDVAFRPVRFFSVLIERHRPAMILVRSLLSSALDAAERAFPALTPTALQDEQPLMRPPRGLP